MHNKTILMIYAFSNDDLEEIDLKGRPLVESWFYRIDMTYGATDVNGKKFTAIVSGGSEFYSPMSKEEIDSKMNSYNYN